MVDTLQENTGSEKMHPISKKNILDLLQCRKKSCFRLVEDYMSLIGRGFGMSRHSDLCNILD
jgi:hypothetical protein|tara:strand:- start:642 stop:827 length:186 start_codon:yes stop_codon:yes gene_type:complete